MFSAVLWLIPPLMIFDHSIHGPPVSQRKQKESAILMRKILIKHFIIQLMHKMWKRRFIETY